MDCITNEVKTKVCRKCGETKDLEEFGKIKRNSDGRGNQCKKCLNEKSKKWRKENPNYYKENYNTEYHKRYQEENKEAILERKRIYYKENIEKEREKTRRYKMKNKDKLKLSKQKRKENKRNSFYFYNTKMWNETLDYFDHKCAYCGNEKELEKDHFFPVSKGGFFVKSNIIPACGWCNRSKKDRDFFTWYQKQDFYSCESEEKILKFVGIKNKIQQLSIL